MAWIRLLLILTALLVILLQRVDVRLSKDEYLTVKINFTLFAIVLTDTEPYKRYFIKPFRLFGNLKGIYKATRFLLSRSTLILSPEDGEGEENNSLIDVSLHFSLLRLIISALILLYYIVKNKVKRVIKHV